MDPLIPLFWTSGDTCPGFQSLGGSLFVCFLTCVILRFTSGATPADCTEVSMATEPSHKLMLHERCHHTVLMKSNEIILTFPERCCPPFMEQQQMKQNFKTITKRDHAVSHSSVAITIHYRDQGRCT